MNPVNSKKLLQSKWTAVNPRNRDKHYIVIEVLGDEVGVPRHCVLQAVRSRRDMEIEWRDLRDAKSWKVGWQ